MQKHSHATAAPYKIIYLGFLIAMALIVIAGSYLLLDDPRFKTASLITSVKRLYYTTSFMSANALGAMPTEDAEQQITDPHSIPVLVYHGILDKSDGSDINLTEEQFKEHMFTLKRAGYTSVTINDLYAFAKEGKALPHNPILITFDDGRSDSFYNADPILDAVDFTAVMFVITDFARDSKYGGYYLTNEEVQLMAKNGRWEIGSHSASGHDPRKLNESDERGNFFSNHIWLEEEGRVETEEEFRTRITNDLKASRIDLEDLLSTGVQSFAFPFGDLGQNQLDSRDKSKDIIDAASSVYSMLFYQQRPGEYFTQFTPGVQSGKKALLIKRINMQNTWDANDLLTVLKNGEEKKLPYIDTFSNDNGWLRAWGEKNIGNSMLTLRATDDSTGASVILDGSQHWKNYLLSAEVLSPNRTGVFVWMRFHDDHNHAACNFGTNFVHVEQMLNGEKRVLKGVQRPNSIPEGWFTISAEVNGRTLICRINGIEIVRSDFLEPTLTQGGTGVKIWDNQMGKSSLQIRQLKVTDINSEE